MNYRRRYNAKDRFVIDYADLSAIHHHVCVSGAGTAGGDPEDRFPG